MLMTPLTVKNAASRRRRSPGPTSECSNPSSRPTDAETEAVREADDRGRPRSSARSSDRADVHHGRAREHAALAEPGRPRMQADLPVVLQVEQRVEEVEAGDPEGNRGAQRPRLPRKLTGDGHPRANRGQPERRAEPEVAEPGEALQIRVDDEHANGNRPEPAHDRVEVPHGEEVERQRRHAERHDLGAPERAGRELSRGRAGVARVELGVDQPVERHRQRPCADHREHDPGDVGSPRPAADREHRADDRERQREHRVLELDEAR